MVAVRPRATLILAVISLSLTISTNSASAQSFKSTGSMTTGRIGHTATLLNGGKVLVTAGVGPTFNYIGSAELYDPSVGAFSPSGNLAAARIFHTATLLNSGKVLVIGGTGSSGYIASAELYDPSTGIFSSSGSMTTGRYLHTATRLNGGKVLVTGGLGPSGYLAGAELYDPSTGTFSVTGSMATGRNGQQATLLDEGRALITGGLGSSGYLPALSSTSGFTKIDTHSSPPVCAPLDRILRNESRHPIVAKQPPGLGHVGASTYAACSLLNGPSFLDHAA